MSPAPGAVSSPDPLHSFSFNLSPLPLLSSPLPLTLSLPPSSLLYNSKDYCLCGNILSSGIFSISASVECAPIAPRSSLYHHHHE